MDSGAETVVNVRCVRHMVFRHERVMPQRSSGIVPLRRDFGAVRIRHNRGMRSRIGRRVHTRRLRGSVNPGAKAIVDVGRVSHMVLRHERVMAQGSGRIVV